MNITHPIMNLESTVYVKNLKKDALRHPSPLARAALRHP